MSDLFRCRASTWSAGAVPDHHDHDPDQPRIGGFDYGDCAASVSAAAAAALALHSANASGSPIDPVPGNTGTGGFHYSPTDLTSQEFSNNSRRHPMLEKTPSETASDYAQNFFTSSPPPRSSRDWNTSGTFAQSNFSVLSVTANSPFGGHHADNSGSLLTPYGNSSPYTNGQQQQQQTSQPGLHSGSPSSVGSQLSNMMSGGLSANTPTTTPTTQSSGNGGTSGSAAKRPARRNPWGSETYSDLIAKAIESYPDKQATLQQIYDYISTNYTYFRERSDPPASAGWKNSIRHNLSLHDKFVKCPKASESSKSSYWRLNANSLNRPYVRRRTCSLDTPGNGGNGSVGGKKAKSRLGSSGAALVGNSGSNTVSAGKRSAAQMGGRDMKTGIYGDDLSAAAVRSHLNSLSSGITSAFSIPGGAGGGATGLKGDPSGGLNHHHNPWANSGFLTDRKMANDELSALW
ncbi:unnamed protein product [Hymenolepis diminuta]|uniref:Fork-head domain-containing protein n=1 Tax=Hymenolepis diminuta TaxID=6216 RepID=A0A564Y342_HYMDI|nr:unnamed protein product [Hymenolepis diminuta]